MFATWVMHMGKNKKLAILVKLVNLGFTYNDICSVCISQVNKIINPSRIIARTKASKSNKYLFLDLRLKLTLPYKILIK